ncbi:hypothetical protein ACFQZ2_00240 [Streptomonospora algeriensis]|uniref:Glutathionylspermidine synthase pre-ATP-grasp-like domain-containing protein n=1 Tax=Streptomonospora algeriensis TaxID=995084 RepID=A0ABW3BA65_9ACTN
MSSGSGAGFDDHGFDEERAALQDARELDEVMRGLPFTGGDDIPVRPLQMPEREYEHCFAIARRFTSLLERTCRSMAESPRGLRSLLGADADLYHLFDRSEVEWRWGGCMSRTDGVFHNGIFKIMECNIGAAIGGVVSMHMLTSYHLGRSGGRAADPLAARAGLFGDVCEWLGREPAVALLGTMREDNVGDDRYFTIERDYLRARGFAADFLEPEELVEEFGSGNGAARYPAVFRHYLPIEWDQMGIDTRGLRRVLESGAVLLSPETAFMLQNKKVLAWMSEGRPWHSESDREFVERHLPWTRVAREGKVAFQGREWDMAGLLLDRQDEFVLKKADSFAGLDVVIGRHTSDVEWKRAVAHALGGDWIAQEYVEPDRRHVPFVRRRSGDLVSAEAPVVYGFLLMGGRSGGCMARHSLSENAVINRHQGASLNIVVHSRPGSRARAAHPA